MIAESVSLRSALEIPDCPFPGLRSFKETESHLFFGRDEQAEKLVVKLAERRSLAVVGTSGSGKSSLVRAGLIPALRSGMMAGTSHKWRIAEMRPTNDPIGNLARALNAPTVFGSQGKENAIQNSVTEATLRLGSRGLIEAVSQNPLADGECLLVLVDQFEELFRFARQEPVPRAAASGSGGESPYRNDAAAFVKLLLEAVKPNASGQQETNIYVVLTMRSDFLGDCSQFWDLPEVITESQYLIPRLTREQLRQVIEGPVSVGGGEIAPRLVNQLLNDIADDQDQLPILQHALMRTWDAWQGTTFVVPPSGGDGCEAALPLVPSDHRLKAELQTRSPIDLEHYEAIGGMASALSKHADEAFEKDLPDNRHRLIAERMFKALTEKGDDNREIRRPVEFGKLCAVAEASEDELKTVIEAFRESGRSFLMPPVGAPLEETTLVDISHESLIRVWMRLQQWANEEAESAAIYLRLADAARRRAELWRGKDLQEAEDWLAKNTPTEVWAERYDADFAAAMDFLSESQRQREEEIAFAERQQREEAERAKRELVQAQALAETQRQRAEEQIRSATKLRRLVLGLLVLGCFAGVAAVIAFTQYRAAESNLIQSRSLLYVANQLLAVNDYDQKQIARAWDSLEASFPAPGASKQEDMRGFDWFYLWRQMHPEKQTLNGHASPVRSVAFSPDGRTLATGSDDNTVKLWDIANGKELRTLEGHADVVSSVAFSPDGRTLATGSYDRTVKLWDIANGKELRTLEGHASPVWSVAFSPDGRTLVSGGGGERVKDGKETRFGEILLWRAATDEEVARQCNRCGRKE